MRKPTFYIGAHGTPFHPADNLLTCSIEHNAVWVADLPPER
jgi:hypothetical protein